MRQPLNDPICLECGVAIRAKTARLGHHVFQAALLNRLDELIGLFDRSEHRRHSSHHMLVVLKHIDAVTCVARRISGDKYRLYSFVLDHFFQRLIRLVTPAGLHQRIAPLADQITDRYNVNIRMILKAEGRPEAAYAVADNSDAHLPRRNWLPFFLYLPLPRTRRANTETTGGCRSQ